MANNFILDNMEIRSEVSEGVKKIVVKGYAIAKDIPHVYKTYIDKNTGKVIKSFKSLFTGNAMSSIERQLKHKKVFIDVNHEVAAYMNSKNIINNLKDKVSEDVKIQLDNLESQINLKELPLFKPISFEIKDEGLFLEIESNPHFAKISEEYKNYYDAIIGSVVDGYLNGFSVNFNTTKVIDDNGLEKIDDVDIYGISIVPNAALTNYSGITEVAVRSMIEIRTEGEKRMEDEKKGKMEEKKGIDESKIEEYLRKEMEVKLRKEIEEKLKQEMLERDKIDKEKSEQKQLLDSIKQDIENIKKGADKGSKGTPPQPPAKEITKEELFARIGNLSFKELAQLQYEFNDKFNPVEITTERASKGVGYKLKSEPILDSSFIELHKKLKQKEKADFVF